MKRAFEEGWGGVICKTLSLDSSKVNNVTPRYARSKTADGTVIGWENIELISDRPFETMLDEMKALKAEFPNRCAPLPSHSKPQLPACSGGARARVRSVQDTDRVDHGRGERGSVARDRGPL